MSRMSKKTRARLGLDKPTYSDPCAECRLAGCGDCEYADSLSNDAAAEHSRSVRMWGLISIILGVFLCLHVLATCFDYDVVEKVGHLFNGSKQAVAKEANIATDLGIDKPDLIPLTAQEKEREEKERRRKFKEEHDGSEVCVYYCGKGCNGHDKCIHCGEPMRRGEKYTTSRYRRRR